MKEQRKYQIQDLIEKIEKVDAMIKLHSSNPSKFMLDQYQAKKEKLLSYLIEELTDSSIRSPYSFRLIVLALKKFYPDIQVKSAPAKKEHAKALKELEKLLAA